MPNNQTNMPDPGNMPDPNRNPQPNDTGWQDPNKPMDPEVNPPIPPVDPGGQDVDRGAVIPDPQRGADIADPKRGAEIPDPDLNPRD